MKSQELKIGGLYKSIWYNPLVFLNFKLANESTVRHSSSIPGYTGYSPELAAVLLNNTPFMVLSLAIPYRPERNETCWQVLFGDRAGWLWYTSYFTFEEVG